MNREDGMLLSHKKEWDFAICSNMDDLEGFMLTEKIQRKTYTVCCHLYVESKKYNKLVNVAKKETDL